VPNVPRVFPSDPHCRRTCEPVRDAASARKIPARRGCRCPPQRPAGSRSNGCSADGPFLLAARQHSQSCVDRVDRPRPLGVGPVQHATLAERASCRSITADYIQPDAALLCPEGDPLLRRSVSAAGQPAWSQVSRGIGLSGSDREFPVLTGPIGHAAGTVASSSRTSGGAGRLAVVAARSVC
jgi:hypothetical protein